MAMHSDDNLMGEGFRDFYKLMPRRVKNILIVSSLYDKFILEEEGRLGERLVNEYLDLNLQNAPQVHRATNNDEAFEMLEEESYDCVLTMLRVGSMDAFTFAQQVKERYPRLPVILLAHHTLDLEATLARADLRGIDDVFVWNGDAKIVLAIIKAVEDRLNVDHDTEVGGVRVIVLVEDSPYFTSIYLPLLFTNLVKQTQAVMSDSVTQVQRLLRMRARPKVLLARTFEQAVELCQSYGRHLLGVISDIRFPREQQLDSEAGFRLLEYVQTERPNLPVLLQSSDLSNRERAESMGAYFAYKDDPNLFTRINDFIREYFGFGDFIFRMPDGTQVTRVRNVMEMARAINEIPDESLRYHASRNHFSTWLRARTEFGLAAKIQPVHEERFGSISGLRQYLANQFSTLERRRHEGEVVEFSPEMAKRARMLRIGHGSIGGKARGLAFMNHLIYQHRLKAPLEGVRVSIPRTAVVATDYFDMFMRDNELDQLVRSDRTDEEILQAFLSIPLPLALESDLRTFLKHVKMPLAVRSSSLLEDAMYRPFAGVYETTMVPNCSDDLNVRLKQLCDAVRFVYASTYFRRVRDYVAGTLPYRKHFEEEKMAVVIQEVVGRLHGNRFYPAISAVARSHNYYPFGGTEPDDGVVDLAFGLGKTIVEGEISLQYCPARPTVYPQFPTVEAWLERSQNEFWAIRMDNGSTTDEVLDATTFMERAYVSDALDDGTLNFVASTYLPTSDRLYDGLNRRGSPVVTFAPILKSNVVPLNEALQMILAELRMAMNCDIEIEFAVNLDPEHGTPAQIGLLQIRPLSIDQPQVDVDFDEIPDDDVIAYSELTLGNGRFDEIRDVVYVKPSTFEPTATRKIAKELSEINRTLLGEQRQYVLIGFGRWGSSDPSLGIPVEWPHISASRVIVEACLPHMQIDPSQGSHFFHNLTSHGVCYMTLHYTVAHKPVNFDWLDGLPVHRETEYVRHVRLDEPLLVMFDARERKGVIVKSAAAVPSSKSGTSTEQAPSWDGAATRATQPSEG